MEYLSKHWKHLVGALHEALIESTPRTIYSTTFGALLGSTAESTVASTATCTACLHCWEYYFRALLTKILAGINILLAMYEILS